MDFIFFFLLFSSLSHLSLIASHTQNPNHICLNQERSSLWEFKKSFTIDTNHSKTSSWRLVDDCCSWDGVECEDQSGHVIDLDLSSSFLYGSLSSSNNSLFDLPRLERLNLAYNDFNSSVIPSWIASLSSLENLNLSHSSLVGEIPDFVSNLTRLRHLDLSMNRFGGEVPRSFSNLKNLQSLDLYGNDLSGNLDFDIFHNMKDLYALDMSLNNLTLLVHSDFGSDSDSDYDLRKKYRFLGFASCSLTQFPDFLRDQDELVWLDLSNNLIHGEVPKWIWNSSLENIEFLNISHNFLTGFQDHPTLLPWMKLQTLDISFNFLEGALVIPPASINFYLASNNKMTGSLPPRVCDLINAIALDVSYNNLTGKAPQCLGKLGKSLSILNLQGNSFRGPAPGSWINGCVMKMINLSENEFEGEVPRSLTNCKKLQFMDLGLNRLDGNFPFWLGAHPELRVMCLRHNRLNGAIDMIKTDFPFEAMRILDLSFNNFSGNLPSIEGSRFLSSMRTNRVDETLTYMNIELQGDSRWDGSHNSFYDFSMKVTNKGMERVYRRIPNIFRGIDLSHNEFTGSIPQSFKNLKGIHLLTLGTNKLTGSIPPSLGQLREIESLDLSDNELSGGIPQDLAGLTSLSFFNVSYNELEGDVPRGNQFGTFEMSSFEGNVGLCGEILMKKCLDLISSEPAVGVEEEEEKDSWFFDEVGLIVVFAGFGGGLVVGVILGNEFVGRERRERLLDILRHRRRDSDTYSGNSYFSYVVSKIWR